MSPGASRPVAGALPAVGVRGRGSRRVRRYRRPPHGCVIGTAAAVRLHGVPARSGRGGRRRARGPRRAGGDADRRREVALLPAARADARRPDDRRLAARGADARPGMGDSPDRPRHGDDGQLPAQRGGQRPGDGAGALRARSGCSTSRPSASDRRRSRGRWPARPWGCSSSTRPTASRNGDTTSGPTTTRWPTPRERLGARATLALTATATPRVAVDIALACALRDPVHVTTGFDRPNLSFTVVPSRGGTDKQRRLVAALSEHDALPAIVYAGTRKACEELTVALDGALDGGCRRLPRRHGPAARGSPPRIAS